MTQARGRAKKRRKEGPLVREQERLRQFWERQQRSHNNLLNAIRGSMPELKEWASTHVESMWGYEDGIYRFYHHSFKVMRLKDSVEEAVGLFLRIRPGRLNRDYQAIVLSGTMEKATRADIVAAFLHTKYFVEMMIKYGTELKEAPHTLPSGWASVLYLYNMR